MIGTVKNGEVLELLVLRATADLCACAQALYSRHGPFRLMLLTVGIDHPHRLTFAQIAPQVLGEQLGVGADHVISRAQNGAGGAVILLKLDHLEAREIDGQFAQVVQRGAAPTVNGLVVIANRGEPRLSGRVAADQQFKQFILGRIGVLVLINQNMPHQPLPTLPGRLMVLQQLQGQADQVVKIHTLVGR